MLIASKLSITTRTRKNEQGEESAYVDNWNAVGRAGHCYSMQTGKSKCFVNYKYNQRMKYIEKGEGEEGTEETRLISAWLGVLI